MIVYLVTDSRDYFPVTIAAFSTRGKAETYIEDECSGNVSESYNIEEMEVK